MGNGTSKGGSLILTVGTFLNGGLLGVELVLYLARHTASWNTFLAGVDRHAAWAVVRFGFVAVPILSTVGIVAGNVRPRYRVLNGAILGVWLLWLAKMLVFDGPEP